MAMAGSLKKLTSKKLKSPLKEEYKSMYIS
jgi:hypothetical protein